MTQITVSEAVGQLAEELAEAWNAGDARAYGARLCADVTFTNTDGSVDMSRDEVVRRAGEVFQGALAGSKLSLTVRKLRVVRPDVAVADLDARVRGVPGMPGGEARIAQLLVLVQEDGRWWITAQHNVMRPAGH